MPLQFRGRIPGPLGRYPRQVRRNSGGRIPGPLGRLPPTAIVLAQNDGPLPTQPVTDDLIVPADGRDPDPVFGQRSQLHAFAVDLFGGADPRPEDVIQGFIGNCFLCGVLVAMAHTRPATIRGMISETGTLDTGFSVHNVFTVRFLTDTVSVNNNLYREGDSGDLVYAHSPDNRASWVSIIEKAYAVLRGGRRPHGGYNRLEQNPPDANQTMDDVVGQHSFVNLSNLQKFPGGRRLNDRQFAQLLRRASREPTIAVTPDSSEFRDPDTGVWWNHAYGVLGIVGSRDSAFVRLRDPHGDEDAAVRLPLRKFRETFDVVLAAD